MKRILAALILGFFIVSCNQVATQQENKEQEETVIKNQEQVRDGVLIHISAGYEDAHRVLMPLKMATLMAEDKDVLVYMDIHAVELLVKGAEDLEHKGFDSFQTYISQLLDQNIDIMACPSCLMVAGYSPEDLMEGIQIAQKDKFFSFTKGRIITLDY